MSTVKIAVAAATRGRPDMFGALLASLQGLHAPDGVELLFIFVQNDAALTIGDALKAFERPAKAVLETELGIPFARNMALDVARAEGCHWLAFLDDDEQAAPDWIVRLYDGAKALGADLAGGPVQQRAPDGMTPSEANVFAYFERMAQERAQKRADGRQVNLHLATNNWIARIASLDAHDLRFDEALRYTGGTDTDLSKRAEAAGLKLGWVPDAIVSEEIPRDRLTAKYVYKRTKSQTMAKYEMDFRKHGKSARLKAFMTFLIKGLSGVLRVLSSPVTGPYTKLKGIRSIAVGMGWLEAAFGGKSRLYEQVQGR